MSSWILVLSMFSSPDGNYIREFSTEKQCTVEMNKLIRNIEVGKIDNVKGIACVPSNIASVDAE
jgi:hypothetical protein